MFIAANVGVMDEVELILPCIQHLRNVGVDAIVVGDMRSTDGTRELLAEETKGGDVFVVDLTADEDMLKFHQRVFDLTIETFSADRIIAQDADEFWIPKSGRLKDSFEPYAADELQVRRFNVPLVDGELKARLPIYPDQYREVCIISRPVPANRSLMDADPDLKHILTQVGSKAAISPISGMGFRMGGHKILAKDGSAPTTSVPDDVIIVHAQYSTWQRFERKVKNIRRSLRMFENQLSGTAAWQWKRWRDIADQGLIEQEYLRQSLTGTEFETLSSNGTIKTVDQYFDERESIRVMRARQSN